MPLTDRGVIELRDLAIAAVLLGAAALAAAAPALTLFGSPSEGTGPLYPLRYRGK